MPAEPVTPILARAAEVFRPTATIIVYRVAGRDVLILRVAHSRRDIEALFGH
jgi:plasmid stabilization system protein ParE